MTERILHFTFGPVQGFINDARRLRDFWAGSFLLSLLSGHAMKAAVNAGATIDFPKVDGDALFEALRTASADPGPYIGSLPNRFRATIPKDQAQNIGAHCATAITDAWMEISNAIWNNYVQDAASYSAGGGGAAKEIWDRQVNSFWDISWVTGESGDEIRDDNWLDQRKNWRAHLQLAGEGGDHCRLMGQFQEISGFHRIGEKEQQAEFWSQLRDRLGKDNLDVQQDERLSAIALIKRFFPVELSKKGRIGAAVPFTPGKDILNIRHWPSTSYIAAAPWLKRLEQERADVEASCHAYLKTISETFRSQTFGEWESPKLFGLPGQDHMRSVAKLDGHLLHADGIQTLVKEALKSDQLRAATSNLNSGLDKICKSLGQRDSGPCRASEFYAVLRMDGDRIGEQIRERKEVIKEALFTFTSNVAKSFDHRAENAIHGVLVYAGGDDVLAIVPAQDAIEAALRLREIFLDAFEFHIPGNREQAGFTISASIVYAHFKRSPLSMVLRESEHYLDAVAKNETGRNAIAIALLKPGGVACDWASTFESNGGRVKFLADLARSGFGGTDPDFAKGFFHKFLHKYRALLEIESNSIAPREGGGAAIPEFLEPLLLHELRQQFGGRDIPTSADNDKIERLKELFFPLKSDECGKVRPSKQVSFGAGLIARFLASEVHLPPTESTAVGERSK